jgi:arginyl-tRNA synthetase
MLSKLIEKAVKQSIKDLGLEEIEFTVEHPVEMEHGDYAVNIAMQLFSNDQFSSSSLQKKHQFKSPRELAELIAAKLKADENLKKIASEITVAGAGFINISIKNEVLVSLLEKVLIKNWKKDKGGFLSGQKIMVEFTDPNPFKEFHIGHLYSNIVGESLSRLFEASGAEVKRANYQGDVGMHVAKSIWGMKQLLRQKDIDLLSLSKQSLVERQKFMGQAYVLGATAYEEDKKAQKEIKDLNRKIYLLDEEIKELYEKGRQWSLEYFETIYQRLGTKFDYYFFEREAGKAGLKLVKQALKKGVFEKSQGAVVFRGDKYGLHTRVFINKLGLPTYEAKDLALAGIKYAQYHYDRSVIVTANEIDEYFKVVLKAMEQVKPELRKKTEHVSHGMVKLPSGKMSSRTGKIITGEWLLDEAKKRALAIMKEAELPDKEQVAEVVGRAAVKYALLKNSIGREVIFDFSTSVSLEGNSGPYLQYTYARSKSVLERAKFSISNLAVRQAGFQLAKKKIALEPEEEILLRTIYRFEEVIQEAAEELAPNAVANFLYDLGQKYNAFYNQHRILQAESERVRQLRLGLTAAVAQVLKNGLYLLGIEAPERM